jgi:TonB family protein
MGFRDGKRNVLTAKVELIGGLGPSEAALTPPSDAIVVTSEKVKNGPGVTLGKLIRRTDFEWPHDVGNGTVWMQVTIGRDGHVRDVRVVTSTSSALTSAAMKAVSQWVYEPYKLNGEPVEVETTVNVNYTLGY